MVVVDQRPLSSVGVLPLVGCQLAFQEGAPVLAKLKRLVVGLLTLPPHLPLNFRRVLGERAAGPP